MTVNLRRLQRAARNKLRKLGCNTTEDDVSEVIALAITIGAREDGTFRIWNAASLYSKGYRASRSPETRGFCADCGEFNVPAVDGCTVGKGRDSYGTRTCPQCNIVWRKAVRYVDATHPADSLHRERIDRESQVAAEAATLTVAQILARKRAATGE